MTQETGGKADKLVLDRIRDVVKDYYLALDKREHGGVAQDKAFEAIQKELGMQWVQGQELSSRAK